MDDQNPLDALDDSRPQSLTSDPNPLDELDSQPAAQDTADKLRGTLQKVDETLPEVTVSHRGGPESSWSDVAAAVMPAIGAKLETKMAGAQESYGSSVEQAAKKRLWQSMILPQAVREAKDQGISLTDHADVVDIAQHLGIRPDQFTRDWPKYANMSQEELQKVQADARARLQSGQSQAEEGSQRRQRAAQVSDAYAPNIPEYGLKSLAFSTATMIPDLLAGTAATVATGGIGGAAAMAASIAPEEYSDARNRGLNDRDASTYATLSTLASSVPEVPVLKVIENAPIAKRIIGGIVGDKLAGTAAGKVAGTAVTQGVTQSVVQALQTGIDEKMFDEDTSLSDALKHIAWAGITGAVAGVPMGAVHAATSRAPRAAQPSSARAEPTIGPDLNEPEAQPESTGSASQVTDLSDERSGSTTLQGPDLHDALKAVQDKTVNPEQLERLESMQLATRNDVNVPRLLPAGRRQLAESIRQQISAKQGGETTAQEPSRLHSDQDLREGLTAMKSETGWAEEGGQILRSASTGEVSGRTSWIPNADWWPNRPKGMSEPAIHQAVDKALAGQPLRPAEQRMVDFMTQVHDERTALQKTHQELQDAVPELHEQPHPAVDLTLLASRAGEHDANATSKVIDSWEDDKPQTLTRVQGELERIIGRGQQEQNRSEGAGGLEPAQTQRSAQAEDLFGEHPQETERRAQFTQQLEQARADTHPEPTDGQKDAGNYRKGRMDFAGMEVALENPKGSKRSGVDDEGHPWESTLKHDYGYFANSRASDHEGVDVFLTGKPDTGKMFVINQVHPETGKYDEAKVVAGARTAAEAESTYKANYSKGWKGLGSMAEMSTERFRQWLKSGQTHKPVRTNVERREDVAQRKKVAEMSTDEAKRELLTHELTDIPNRRAYVESEKLPTQVSIDVDSLKAVNDLGGHHAGDELLKAVARVLHEESEHAYHLSGDEFAVQALHPREAQEVMQRASDRLKDAQIIVTMPDGRVLSLKGLGVSYGVGEDLGKADTALQAHKKQREAEGTRAPRGEAPRGLTFRPGETGREDHGSSSTAKEEVGPKFARRTPELGRETDATLARVRPRNLIAFKKPYVGKTGAKLIGYEWKWRPQDIVDKRGEDSTIRVSDWEQAVVNPETNRDIVHHFHVEGIDGKSDLVSAETAARMLGVSQSMVRTRSARLLEDEISAQHARELVAEHAQRVDEQPWYGAPAEAITRGLSEHLRNIWSKYRDWGTRALSPEQQYELNNTYIPLLYGPKGFQFRRGVPDLSPEFASRGWSRLDLNPRQVWDEKGESREVEAPKFARRNPQTDTPEFKRWFGESKVTDERGEPQVVYHATSEDFSVFDLAQGGARTAENTDSREALTMAQMGVWTSTKPLAGELAHSTDMPIYLRIRRPYRTTLDKLWAKASEHSNGKEFREWLESSGHDGVQLLDTEFGAKSFVVFHPSQIKSATGNRGTFDAGEHNILKRVVSSQGGLPRTHVERIVHQTIREAHLVTGFPHVEVHEDTTTLPEHVNRLIEEQGAQRLTGAVYDPATNRIHIIASNNGSEREVRENLWHEAVGHHGLRMAMDAPQYNAVMDGINRDMPERVKYAAERNSLNLEDIGQRRAAAEEVIAYAAGQKLSGQRIDAPVVSWLTRAVRAVKGFFAKMAGKPFYDDQAILGLIKQAQRALEQGSVGTVPGESLRSSRAPMFYSPVERAVESSKQGKASANQWLATIKKGAGIKPEELEWLDLENWLKGHKDQISKEELADYVRANQLDLEETIHGGEQQTDLERQQTRIAEELRALGHGVDFDQDGHLATVTYKEPTGGYSEYHLHDPIDRQELPESIRERAQRLDDVSQRVVAERERVAEAPVGWASIEGQSTHYADYTLPGGANYREMLLRLPIGVKISPSASREEMRDASVKAEQLDKRHGVYRSSHWKEPNILAHVRFNERTDADGKRVLFLEELQSDWHQAGRKSGYQGAVTNEDIAKKKAEGWEVHRQVLDPGKPSDDPENQGFHAQYLLSALTGPKAKTERAAWEALIDSKRILNVPFKTSWPMLIMKRMVRWAAENGFERIAWTTGEQQAERYNLSQHIDRLVYSRDEDGKYWLYAEKDGLSVSPDLQNEAMTKEQVAGYVGHDIADKMERGEGEYTPGDGPHIKFPDRQLSGLDLRVGGEGMRGFYDQILPRETDKFIKKFGGKTEDTRVQTGIVDPNVNSEIEDRFYREMRDAGAKTSEVEDWLNTWKSGGAEAARSFNHNIFEKYREGFQSALSANAHGFDITDEMRQAALGQGFPMFARRQQEMDLQEQRERGPMGVIHRAINALTENAASRDIRKLIHPAGMSPDAKRTAQIATQALGKLAHESFETQHALEQFSRQIDKLPVVDQLAMIDAIERGEPQAHPELQAVADEMRKLLDTWRDKVRGLGSGYLDKFIENYFPHYWDRGDEAARMVASIQGRRTLRGPATFLKMRTIPTIKEGMEAGLRPLTVNPLIMTLLKTREMQRFVTGVTLLRRLKEDGLAQFIPASRRVPDGWKEIDDPSARVSSWSEEEGGWIDRGRYAMPEDAARIINNHLSPSWLKNFAPAAVFRTGANMLNALQLGFSAFHLGFTTLDAIISKTALGVERLAHGDPMKAVQAFAEAATGPGAAVMNVRRGYQLMKAYANPAGATPQMLKLVDALEKAGGRAQMDRYYLAAQGGSPFQGVGAHSLAKDIHAAITAPTEKLQNLGRALGAFPQEYSTSLLRSMQQLVQTTHPLAVPFEVAGRITRASTSWIMEHVVPMQKLGVFSDLAHDHIERNPQQDPNEQALALQKVWSAVDDRLGEMVYDNLFLNRTFKDMLHFGIRAVGWNWGTWRSIGGAPIDVMKMADKLLTSGRVTADDLGHKIPYVMAMAMTTALYGAIYQYLSTGEGPQELKDYFFPRTGGTTNYGTPQRVSLPSYAKDVYEYSQRPGTTVLNKLNPIFNVIGEMWNNEDFFGNPITDPDATPWEATKQRASFLGHEAAPFSFQGRQQIAGSDQPGVGGTVRQGLPYFGITPAPGYVTSPDQMERRERYEREQKYTKDMKYKMTKAYEAKDKVTGDEYRDRYTRAIKHMKETESEVKKDRGKAAVSRRKAATTLRQQGLPATADLVSTLPLEPDSHAREYFQQLGGEV